MKTIFTTIAKKMKMLSCFMGELAKASSYAIHR